MTTVTAVTAVTIVTVVTSQCKRFLEGVPDVSMANDDPNLCDWNVRKFPKKLRLECKSKVVKSGKPEPRWLAEVLCDALDLPIDVYLDPIYGSGAVLDSPNEGGKEEVRFRSEQVDKGRTPKARPKGKNKNT